MWVKREEHEAYEKESKSLKNEALLLKYERDAWKARYEKMVRKVATSDSVSINRIELANLQEAAEELSKLRPELDLWKQKYADEVQKRLGLLEHISKP